MNNIAWIEAQNIQIIEINLKFFKYFVLPLYLPIPMTLFYRLWYLMCDRRYRKGYL